MTCLGSAVELGRTLTELRRGIALDAGRALSLSRGCGSGFGQPTQARGDTDGAVRVRSTSFPPNACTTRRGGIEPNPGARTCVEGRHSWGLRAATTTPILTTRTESPVRALTGTTQGSFTARSDRSRDEARDSQQVDGPAPMGVVDGSSRLSAPCSVRTSWRSPGSWDRRACRYWRFPSWRRAHQHSQCAGNCAKRGSQSRSEHWRSCAGGTAGNWGGRGSRTAASW
jgi:hypothetical protein